MACVKDSVGDLEGGGLLNEVSVTSDRSLLVQLSCICSEVILKGSVLRSVGLQVSLRVVKATLAMGGCQCVAPLMHIFLISCDVQFDATMFGSSWKASLTT